MGFLPEPPQMCAGDCRSTNGQIALAWAAPVNWAGARSPTNYIIYRSTNGYGFGNPVLAGNVLELHRFEPRGG